MRFPKRAVKDDDVDRLQVQGQQWRSRAVLIARSFLVEVGIRQAGALPGVFRGCAMGSRFTSCESGGGNQGGYGTGDPPLPIPNREVKPRHADGTA